MIDLDSLKAAAPYVLSALAALFAGARWAGTRAFVTRDDFSGLSKRVEAQGHDLAIIRKDIEHLPDARQIAQLSEVVVKLTTAVGAMDQRISGVKDSVSRIEDILMGNGK